MQCAKDKVTCFGGCQCQLNGFKVAHFPYKYDVRVFTQGGSERVGETLGVGAQLALADHRVFMAVQKFNRVFNRENVLALVLIDPVDH